MEYSSFNDQSQQFSSWGYANPLGVRQKLKGVQNMSNFADVFQVGGPRIPKGCKLLVYQKKVIFELSSFSAILLNDCF
jgi:hypothetical protein